MYSRAINIDQTPNINPARQIALIPSQRKSMDMQVLSTTYAEVVKNLEISKLALLRETPLIQIIDTPSYPLDKEKWGKVKGFVIGGFLASLLCIIILLMVKVVKGVMSS
ncbi:hypothetical protein D3C80_1116100 [compost metagenome]